MLWIIIDHGHIFEGTLEEFQDCFFSNADTSSIIEWAHDNRYSVELMWVDDFPVITETCTFCGKELN